MSIRWKRNMFVLLLMALLVVSPTVNAQTVEEAPETEVTAEEGRGRNPDNREERENQRKEEFQARIDQARTLRVAGKCRAAGNRLSARQTAAEQVRSSREQVYGGLQTKLDELVARLQASGANTATLEEQVVQLDQLIADFFVAFDDYQLALNDLVEVDCEADIEAFVLALEDARTQLKSLRELASEIRQFFTDSVLKTMQDIRSGLSDEASENGDTSE